MNSSQKGRGVTIVEFLWQHYQKWNKTCRNIWKGNSSVQQPACTGQAVGHWPKLWKIENTFDYSEQRYMSAGNNTWPMKNSMGTYYGHNLWQSSVV